MPAFFSRYSRYRRAPVYSQGRVLGRTRPYGNRRVYVAKSSGYKRKRYGAGASSVSAVPVFQNRPARYTSFRRGAYATPWAVQLSGAAAGGPGFSRVRRRVVGEAMGVHPPAPVFTGRFRGFRFSPRYGNRGISGFGSGSVPGAAGVAGRPGSKRRRSDGISEKSEASVVPTGNSGAVVPYIPPDVPRIVLDVAEELADQRLSLPGAAVAAGGVYAAGSLANSLMEAVPYYFNAMGAAAAPIALAIAQRVIEGGFRFAGGPPAPIERGWAGMPLGWADMLHGHARAPWA